MGLRESKGNMYEWITHTWNPIKGQCEHECIYCYMKKFKLKPLRLDQKDLRTNLGENNFIFLGSSTDMWARNVPDEWIEAVLERCVEYNTNQYLFQTKNPGRMLTGDFDLVRRFQYNATIGTTIETDEMEGISNAPDIYQRASAIRELGIMKFNTMITIEPILKFNLETLLRIMEFAQPDWVNIGADSKGHDLPEPTWPEIEALVTGLEKFTTIREKHNLGRIQNA